VFVTPSTKRQERLLLSLLLGEAGIAGQVREGDRHAHAPEIHVLVLELALHVSNNVLLDEVLEEALVDVVHHRRRDRQQVAREVAHLLRHLEPGNALPDERLVHVQVEEPHLGLSDLGKRLAIDAADLEEGHQREAGAEHARDVVQRLDVLLAELLESPGGQAEARPEALDQSRLQAGERRGLLQ
jgi:hypothetical protein